jgi:hypothetical protein
MFSSLILSFAMSATPAADINNEAFIIEEIGTRRNGIRIDASSNEVRIGTRRNGIRIDASSNEISIKEAL